MRETAGEELHGVILDLRNNPGGVLDAAVDVSDAFLDGGVIVTANGRGHDATFRHEAVAGDLLDGVLLVVMVNPPRMPIIRNNRCQGSSTCRDSASPPSKPISKQPITFTANVPYGKPPVAAIRWAQPLTTKRKAEPMNPPAPTSMTCVKYPPANTVIALTRALL